jgi:para-aminobenzoate synthetase component I
VLTSKKYRIPENFSLREKIVSWLGKHEVFCILDSQSELITKHQFSFSKYEMIVAAGIENVISSALGHSLEDIDTIFSNDPDWYIGYFSYDLKNSIEHLQSKNLCFIEWPDFFFFKPKYLVLVGNHEIEVMVSGNSGTTADKLWSEIKSAPPARNKPTHSPIKVNARLSKDDYIERVELLKQHIHRGDIYEANFCQEFFASAEFDSLEAFLKMHKQSPAPFSCLLRINTNYLLSASPERFLQKTGQHIISQPIKGTARRGKDFGEDHTLKAELIDSKKERSENIMIVDLVRNDLSKIARANSVHVDELCGIYSFEHVHQMISTISAKLNTFSIHKIIRATFPMGSMTGAPKLNALKLAEKYETTKRGIYSGAVGYISPSKDFDFNVVIRSLQYNAENKYLSYMVGGAITSLSDAEMEYEECLVKARAMEALLK